MSTKENKVNFKTFSNYSCIRTFQLYNKVSTESAQAIKRDLLKRDKDEEHTYREDDVFMSNVFCREGVEIEISPIDNHNEAVFTTFNIARYAIDHDIACFDMFQTDNELSEHILSLLDDILENTKLAKELPSAMISDVSSCIGIPFHTYKARFKTLCMMGEESMPSAYTRIYSDYTNEKSRRFMDDHCVRLAHKSYEYLIFDYKAHEYTEELFWPYPKFGERTLLLEMHYNQKQVKKICQKKELDTLQEQLAYFIIHGKDFLVETAKGGFDSLISGSKKS